LTRSLLVVGAHRVQKISNTHQAATQSSRHFS